jgi:hypothetical protein
MTPGDWWDDIVEAMCNLDGQLLRSDHPFFPAGETLPNKDCWPWLPFGEDDYAQHGRH